MINKSPDAFRTISEVAEWLGVPTHVLRFWESRFSQVKPVKRAGGRRYYRPADMELLGGIRKLLHDDGMTIRGVQKLLREEGVKHVAALAPDLDSPGMKDITPTNVVALDTGQDAGQKGADSPGGIEDAEEIAPPDSPPATSDPAAADPAAADPATADPTPADPAAADPAPEAGDKAATPEPPAAATDAPLPPEAPAIGAGAKTPPETDPEVPAEIPVEVSAETTPAVSAEMPAETSPEVPTESPTGMPAEAPAASDVPDSRAEGLEFPSHGAGVTPPESPEPESSAEPSSPAAPSEPPATTTATATASSPATGMGDISHIPDDPPEGDDETTVSPAGESLLAALRKAPKTAASPDELAALAKRLTSLKERMVRERQSRPQL